MLFFVLLMLKVCREWIAYQKLLLSVEPYLFHRAFWKTRHWVESQEFEIFVEKPENNFVSIPVLLEYQDVNDEKYQKEFDLGFEIYTQKQLSKYDLKKRKNTRTIIIILAVALIAYYFYKKNKKKKQ